MEFQLSDSKSCKMMLWNCCPQYASKFGKLSSGHRHGKGLFSFQSQRKAMPKNAQTIAQLHSSHTLVKYCSKFSKPGLSNMWTMNFQSLPKLMSIESVMPSNQLNLCHPLLLLPSIFPSNRVFSKELVLWKPLQVAKVLEFQLQHQSFQWMFRVDFL